MPASASSAAIAPLPAAPAAPISEGDFHGLVAERALDLLGLAQRLERCPLDAPILSRPLVGKLLAESTQLEELLDAHGARANRR